MGGEGSACLVGDDELAAMKSIGTDEDRGKETLMFETHKVRRILEDLDSEDDRVRAKAMGQLKDNPRLIEALGAVLKNTNEDEALRRRAATALGQLGDALALEPLGVTLLRD